MKLTILGSGPSSGVPTVAEGWGACDPENPRNYRLRPSVLVENGETRLLVDTSPDLRQQLLGHSVQHLDAVLYTHAHADHLHGIDDLRGINKVMDAPLDVYADAETRQTIETRFEYTTTPLADDATYYYKPVLNMLDIDAGDGFTIGDVEIRAFAQDHGPSRTLGYRFGPIAYTTDLNGLPDASFDVISGAQAWIIGVFSWQPHLTHAHVDLALEWIERVKPPRAVLTHLGPGVDYAELSDYLPDGVESAFDGMVIEAE